MKNLFIGLSLVLAGAGAFSGCRDKSKLPEPTIENLPLIIPQYSADPTKTYYDFLRARLPLNTLNSRSLTRPVFEFVINPSNTDLKIRTVEVYKSFGSTVGAVNAPPPIKSPAPLGRNFSFGPRVKFGEYSSFPATVSIPSNVAIADLPYYPAGLGGIINPVAPTDNTAFANVIGPGTAVVFTFEYVLEDGRRIILTPLDSRGAVTGTFANAPYAAVALFATK